MNEVLYGFDYVSYYFFLLYYKFIGYPMVLRICISIVTLCVIFYLFLAVYIVWGIFSRRNDKNIRERIFCRYYEPLLAVLTDPARRRVDEIAEFVGHNIKKRLKNKEMRFLVQVLTKIKIDAGDRFNNVNSQAVQGVFKVGSFLEREIQFGRPKFKVQALLAIQSINGYVSEAVLVRFLYHRKMELRHAARYAFMWLSQNNPFRFFDEDLTMKLHRWDMAEIHAILIHRQQMGFVLPNFIKWVNDAVEENVKIFFVREIRYFDERENCAQLAEMLNTKTWSLRSEIVRTLGQMRYAEAEDRLTAIYDVQPEFIKQDILASVAEIDSGRSAAFLRTAYETADDMTTKLSALKALYRYGAEGRAEFARLESDSEGFTAKLFAHIRNPLISRV